MSAMPKATAEASKSWWVYKQLKEAGGHGVVMTDSFKKEGWSRFKNWFKHPKTSDKPQGLMDVIHHVEKAAGRKARIVHEPMHAADVPALLGMLEEHNYRGWLTGDKDKNARFNAVLRSRGIFKAPGKLYPSLAVTDDDLEQTDAAIVAATAEIA